MQLKTYLFVLLVFISGIISGCVHTPVPYLASDQTRIELLEVNFKTQIKVAKLQVIITYNPLFCTHTALRLVRANAPPVLWDPAGSYGTIGEALPDFDTRETTINRTNDLIMDNVPSLDNYWQFSLHLNDVGMEVFEWQIPNSVADSLLKRLQMGADLLPGDEHDFKTETTGFFCSVAVSDFLNRYAKQFIPIQERYFFPHNLAEHLYQQDPTRIVIYRKGEKKLVYHTVLRHAQH